MSARVLNSVTRPGPEANLYTVPATIQVHCTYLLFLPLVPFSLTHSPPYAYHTYPKMTHALEASSLAYLPFINTLTHTLFLSTTINGLK